MQVARSCPNGFLPVYSVDHLDQAERLLKVAENKGIVFRENGKWFSTDQANKQELSKLSALGKQLDKIYKENKAYVDFNYNARTKSSDFLEDPPEENKQCWEMICYNCDRIECYSNRPEWCECCDSDDISVTEIEED